MKRALLLLLLVGLSGCRTTDGTIDVSPVGNALYKLCQAQPTLDVCKVFSTPAPRPTATPTPAATATPTPCPPGHIRLSGDDGQSWVCYPIQQDPRPTPTPDANGCYPDADGCNKCCPLDPANPHIVTCTLRYCGPWPGDWTPTPTPTSTPAPTPAPTQVCIPKPGPGPVSIAWPKRCPPYMVPIWQDDPPKTAIPRGYGALCGLDLGQGDYHTAKRLGLGLERGSMRLVNVNGAWLQEQGSGHPGDLNGCTDAYGMWYPDCGARYPTGPLEDYPYGERGPYEFGGYPVPTFCEDMPATPTPRPTAAPGQPTPVGDCPPLTEVEWDVLRIANKDDRSNAECCDGSPARPARAADHIIVGHVTPKMSRPYCPNGRIICELTAECQDRLVGRPIITQTLPGLFEGDKVVQNSSNAFITFMNLAPGEVGRYEITACTEWRTHCTTSYVWVE